MFSPIAPTRKPRGRLDRLCLLGAAMTLWSAPGYGQFRDAIADAWLEEAAPTQNYGGDNELAVQGTAADSQPSVSSPRNR